MRQKISRLIRHQGLRDIVKIIFLIFWLVLIFIFSTLPGQGTPADFLTGVSRKIAHFVEFAILMFLFFKVIRLYFKETFTHAIFIAIFFSVMYAISDELHQLFVFGRFGTIRDVVIDTFGILLMAGLLYLEHEHQTNFPNKVRIVKI